MTWNESPSLNLGLVNLDKEREAERPIASRKHPGPALSISDQTGPGTRREALLAEEKKHQTFVSGQRNEEEAVTSNIHLWSLSLCLSELSNSWFLRTKELST